jgi:hypothetical protein
MAKTMTIYVETSYLGSVKDANVMLVQSGD